jgi:hypothetical protein
MQQGSFLIPRAPSPSDCPGAPGALFGGIGTGTLVVGGLGIAAIAWLFLR